MADADPAAEGTDLVLRAAGPADAPALAEVFLAARAAAYPAMPHVVHTPTEVHSRLLRRLEAGGDTWLAERGAQPVGYLALDAAWLDSVYVHPDLTGQGIGSALLDLAKSLRPDGFGLWVFESNEPARRFYSRHGLVEIRCTDGSENDEREPAVELAWLGADPVAALRRRIDEVDDELAALLDRRAGLTGQVQAQKAVPGHAGRDRAREAEIAVRMSGRAPRLGRERIERIMHVVISESLDAVEESRP
jgi:chorismate mutase/GNAT superfamily N-acetyltransferase